MNQRCPNYVSRSIPSGNSSSSASSAASVPPDNVDETASDAGDDIDHEPIENQANDDVDTDEEAGDSVNPAVEEVWQREAMEFVENYNAQDDFPHLNTPYPVGPRDIPDDIKRSPLAFWKLFVTDDIIQRITDQSNSYAETIQTKHKHSIFTFDEILAFIGIIIFMGINVIGDRHRYCQKGPLHNSYVASVMSRWRFDWILRCFHWIDTTKISQEEKVNLNKTDHFCLWMHWSTNLRNTSNVAI